MKFDLNSTPPSAADIATERVALTRTLAVFGLRKRWILMGGLAGMAVTLTVVYATMGGAVAGAALLTAVWVMMVIALTSATPWEAVGVGAVVTVMAAIVAVAASAPAVVLFAAVAATTVAAVVAYIKWAAYPLFEANNALADIDILAQERCPEVLEWCRAHPVVAAYQTAVAQQGRMLVEGELIAMKRGLAVADTQKAQAEELAACERLMQPVTAS